MTNDARLTFYKMHSLGNDFMVVDGVTRPFEPDAGLIATWGDRNSGVGFDQLLVIEPPTQPDADFWYRIFNADGSAAEQCGNGTRCVHLLVHHLGLSVKADLRWQSAAGMLHTRAHNDQFTTTMTPPVLDLAEIPFDTAHTSASQQCGTVTGFTLASEVGDFVVTPVSMGNPHAVIFCDDILSTDVDGVGRALTAHPAFPQRANIGFCQVIDRQFMRLRVFERGVGETQACGSGACAAMVAAHLTERVGTRVKVSLPGGKLRIAWQGCREEALTMTGPATLVYKGEIFL